MSKKILIAEDEKPMAKALELKLNSSGYEAKAVFDGEQAIAALNSTKYDLLLLDLMMPKKDGLEVLKTVGPKGAKVVIISAVGQDKMIEDAKAAGALGYIVKPFEEKQVVEEVKKAIN